MAQKLVDPKACLLDPLLDDLWVILCGKSSSEIGQFGSPFCEAEGSVSQSKSSSEGSEIAGKIAQESNEAVQLCQECFT